PAADFSKILLVDDHSPHAGDDYRAFLAHHAATGRLEVLSLGEARASHYTRVKGESVDGQPTSAGHGGALDARAPDVIARGGRGSWRLDSDCLVLDGACLRAALAKLEPDVDTVGDYERGRPGERDGKCDGKCVTTGGLQVPRTEPHQGRTNAV